MKMLDEFFGSGPAGLERPFPLDPIALAGRPFPRAAGSTTRQSYDRDPLAQALAAEPGPHDFADVDRRILLGTQSGVTRPGVARYDADTPPSPPNRRLARPGGPR